jgi:ketosteroid isomerase-like protein
MTTLTSIVEELYECFAAGDLDAMLRHAEPDIVLTQDDRLPWGGRHVGPEGVAEFGLKLAATVDTTVVPQQLFAAGATVIQVGRIRGTIRANGVTYDVPECHVWTFRGDKVASVDMFIESDSILELLAR